jgi:hypothetical protein
MDMNWLGILFAIFVFIAYALLGYHGRNCPKCHRREMHETGRTEKGRLYPRHEWKCKCGHVEWIDEPRM